MILLILLRYASYLPLKLLTEGRILIVEKLKLSLYFIFFQKSTLKWIITPYFIFSSSEWSYYQESTYQAKNTKFSQSIHPRNILLEPKSQTAYCFIHKVASSTWMKLFTNIHKDEKRFKAIIHFGQYYK